MGLTPFNNTNFNLMCVVISTNGTISIDVYGCEMIKLRYIANIE